MISEYVLDHLKRAVDSLTVNWPGSMQELDDMAKYYEQELSNLDCTNIIIDQYRLGYSIGLLHKGVSYLVQSNVDTNTITYTIEEPE